MQPWKLGGSESGRNEALRPRKSCGFKRANLAAWSFGVSEGQPTEAAEPCNKRPETYGLQQDKSTPSQPETQRR